MSETTPQISVVICTRNEETNIGRCLASLRQADYPAERMEVIVVDNSQDRTGEIARSAGAAVYRVADEADLSKTRNLRGGQLNFGVSRATGEIIFYPDADMTFDPNLLREVAAKLGEFDALYVPEVVRGRGWFGTVRNFERSFYNGTCVDAVRFVKKSVFEKVGGFDERDIVFGPDDWDFTLTLQGAGFKLGMTTAEITHREEALTLRRYISKKGHYAETFCGYIDKWGRAHPIIRKQFSPWYRVLGIFLEDGKWRRFLSRPHLALGVLFLRFLVGMSYLLRR